VPIGTLNKQVQSAHAKPRTSRRAARAAASSQTRYPHVIAMANAAAHSLLRDWHFRLRHHADRLENIDWESLDPLGEMSGRA